MTEPSSSDRWSSLADMLGVDPSAPPQSTPTPAASEPSSPPPEQPRPKAAAPPKPRPTANWGDIAGKLGVEVPPEPEPTAGPPTKPVGTPQFESLVRGTPSPAAERSDRPAPERRDVERSGGHDRPPRRHGDRGGREQSRERGRGREESQGREGGRGRGRGRGRDDRGGRPTRRDDRGRHDREQERPTRNYRDDVRRDPPRDDREARSRADRGDYDHVRSERDILEGESVDFGERLAADEQTSPFGMPPLELQDSGVPADEAGMGLADEADDAESSESEFVEEQDSQRDRPLGDGTGPTRRRRRRRGRRGVLREDAFLGIERLATEDIVGHEAAPAETRLHDVSEDRDDSALGEEITSIEIGGDEDTSEAVGDAETDVQRRRRRRRRRGRGSRERSAESTSARLESDDETEPRRDERKRRPDVRDDNLPDDEDDDDTDLESGELESHEDGARPNKNLHREVTPWAEAIGFIVSANMESRAKSPSGGGQRGRWSKGERRS